MKMISKNVRNLNVEDIKALFNAGNDDFINQRRDKLEFNRILNGDVTAEEYKYLVNRFDNIVIKDAFEHGDMISTDTHKAIFSYKPSELVQVTQHFSKLNLSVPVLDYNSSNGIVVNKFDFSVNTPEKVEASVSEELMQDDNIALFSDILNSEMNMKVEDKIIQALNSTTCTANNFVNGIEQLDKKHLRNLSVIVPYSDFIDSPQLYNYNNKVNVILAPVSNIFIGNMKAIVSNAFVDSVKYDKNIKNGVYTIIERIYSLNAVLTNKDEAIAKIS